MVQPSRAKRRTTTIIDVVSKGKAKKRFVGIVGGFFLPNTKERYYRMRIGVKLFTKAEGEQASEVYFEGGMDVDVFYVQGESEPKHFDLKRTLAALQTRFPRIELERIARAGQVVAKRDGKDLRIMTDLKVHVSFASLRRLKLLALIAP